MRTMLRFFIIFLLVGCTSQRSQKSHIPVTSVITTRTEALVSAEYPTFLSNYARLFIHSLSQEIPICSIPTNYVPSDPLMKQFPIGVMQDSIFCITGFLEVDKKFNLSQLKKAGIYFVEGNDLFSTAFIPLSSLCEFLKMKGIIRFELTRRGELSLNVARPAVNAQILLHPPLPDKTAYTGKGVIIGIVDYGFDYTHPDFYDSTGSDYRIRQVWEQMNSSGTPPTGFQYGSEWKDQQAILTAATDTESQTHGTHVAGIAAGSGAGTEYYGLAPAADLILVSTDRTDVGIANGLKYISDYAAVQQKPCVINFSLGSSIGPHDGTSAFDRLCDASIRPGLLFTGSVGNNGNQPIYLAYEFLKTPTDTLVLSGIKPGPNEEQVIVDLWGSPSARFSAGVFLLDTLTMRTIGETPWVASEETKITTYRITTDSTVAVIQYAAETSPYNQKPTIMLQVSFVASGLTSVVPVLKIKSQSAINIQSWLTGGNFSTFNQPLPYQSGSTTHTVGEIGGTGKSILSAGAFCTKRAWVSVDGESYQYAPNAVLGEIADFSSRGPTADGRIKPDITCPGYGVVSAFSHYFDGSYPPSFYRTTRLSFQGVNYYFGILQGTSGAAPIIAGTLALWLQQYPQLTFLQARDAIRKSAIPAPISPLPDNTWGWGILNAAGGMQLLK